MKTSRICGLLVVLGLPVGLAPAEELFLPPAGKDVFPATRAVVRLQLDVLRLGPAAKGLVTETGLMEIELSGPVVVERGDPSGTGGTIDTEIVSMSLTGSGGTRIRLDPTQRSLGEIQGDPENPFHADSFFDVFFEIEVPQLGVLSPVDIDGQPTPVRMSSTIGHIPPIGSVYFGEQQVSLAFVNDRIPVATLIHVQHDVGRPPKPETRGEVSRVFSCFYECKPSGLQGFWQEITTLMLVNQSATFPITAEVLYLNGNERPIASNRLELSPLDLDEINVCSTLENGLGAFGVPQAGVIEVVLSPAGGVYGWVKNLTGRFNRLQPEPYLESVTK